jgi:hypothetical protein
MRMLQVSGRGGLLVYSLDQSFQHSPRPPKSSGQIQHKLFPAKTFSIWVGRCHASSHSARTTTASLKLPLRAGGLRDSASESADVNYFGLVTRRKRERLGANRVVLTGPGRETYAGLPRRGPSDRATDGGCVTGNRQAGFPAFTHSL